MDRRTTLQWMLTAAALPMWQGAGAAVSSARPAGYGTDPNVVKVYRAGELWPLKFTAAQRRTAAVLCDVIIPADAQSPGAAELQVHVFIDEWISAPYPAHVADRKLVVQGLAWLNVESIKRFGQPFIGITAPQQRALCDDICSLPVAKPELAEAAKFFARFRDLTAGGFYTTPEGTRDLGFVGNKPSETFDGPPAAVLKIVGVS